MLLLPRDLFNEIGTYLGVSDLVHLQNTSKEMIKIKFKDFTFFTDTIYKDCQGNSTIQRSYLLTNGSNRELPSQIKQGYVEIKLYRGRSLYHFIICQNIYRPEQDILDYLKQSDPKKTTKKIYQSNRFYNLAYCQPRYS